MQSFDFENFQVTLCGSQVVVNEQGHWEIVIADRPPQEKNWLDTAGHSRGFVYFRWLLAAESPAAIEASVVPLASLTGK